MPVTRKLPPVWLLGFTNATFGMYAGFSVVTLPLMLAHLGLPGGKIAELTAAVSSPGFWIFLVAPILDVRFSRRSYALIFAVLAACAMGLAVAHRQNALFLEVTLFGAMSPRRWFRARSAVGSAASFPAIKIAAWAPGLPCPTLDQAA
jgi:PAT family beta-lactamase induction signal transducer AmpG